MTRHHTQPTPRGARAHHLTRLTLTLLLLTHAAPGHLVQAQAPASSTAPTLSVAIGGTAPGLDRPLTFTLPSKSDLSVVLATLARAADLTLLARDVPAIPVTINAKGLTVRAALEQVLSVYADKISARLIGTTLIVAPQPVIQSLFARPAPFRAVLPLSLATADAARLTALTGADLFSLQDITVISGTPEQVRDAQNLLAAARTEQGDDTPAAPVQVTAPLEGVDPELARTTLTALHEVKVTVAYGRAYIQAPSQPVLTAALATLASLVADRQAQPDPAPSADAGASQAGTGEGATSSRPTASAAAPVGPALDRATVTTPASADLVQRLAAAMGVTATPLDAGTFIVTGATAALSDFRSELKAAEARDALRVTTQYPAVPASVLPALLDLLPTVTARVYPGGIEVRGTPLEQVRVSAYLNTVSRVLPMTDVASHTTIRVPLAYVTPSQVLPQLRALYPNVNLNASGAGAAAAGSPGAGGQPAATSSTTAAPASATADLFGGVRAVADDRSRAVILTGPADALGRIQRTIADLDLRLQDVRMALRVEQIANSSGQDLGINWQLGIGGLSVGHTDGKLTAGYKPSVVPASFDVTLNAARTSGRSNLLLDTVFTAQDGARMPFKNGGQLFVPVTSTTTSNGQTTTTTTRETYEYGLEVALTPKLGHDGRVELRVDVQLGQPPRAGLQNSIVIERQTLSTVVTLTPGETVLLGGILNNGDTSQSSGVPILSEIPVVGTLFGKTNVSATQNLLLITLQAADAGHPSGPRPVPSAAPTNVTRVTTPGK